MSDPVPSPAALPSLSQRLVEFSSDVFPLQATDVEYAGLLRIVVTAWNLAIVPGNAKVSQGLDDALLKVPPVVRQRAEVLLSELVERKKEHYAADTRVVVEARIRRTDTNGLGIDTRSYDYAVYGDKYL